MFNTLKRMRGKGRNTGRKYQLMSDGPDSQKQGTGNYNELVTLPGDPKPKIRYSLQELIHLKKENMEAYYNYQYTVLQEQPFGNLALLRKIVVEFNKLNNDMYLNTILQKSEEQQKKMDEFVSFRQKQIEKDPECPVCYTHFSQIKSMIQCQVCKSSVCSKCASDIIKSNDSWKCPCCRDEQINFVQHKYPNRVIVKKLTIQSWVFKLFYMNFKQTGRNFFGKEIVSNTSLDGYHESEFMWELIHLMKCIDRCYKLPIMRNMERLEMIEKAFPGLLDIYEEFNM
jgi:hypothetical protein